MADFQQSGVITTLHRLGTPGVERLERELLSYSRSRPISLVLPCLVSELRGDGLKGIVDILRGVRYLRQIVVSISGSEDRADYEKIFSKVIPRDNALQELLKIAAQDGSISNLELAKRAFEMLGRPV